MQKTQIISQATDIAILALQFMTEDVARLTGFFQDTGLNPEDITDLIQKPEFLIATLEYMLKNESLLLAFCAHKNIKPEEIFPAYITLSGTDEITF